MKVLLIEPASTFRNTAWNPLGKLYLAAVARREGFDVRIIDNNLFNFTDEQLIQQIRDFGPDIAGTGGRSTQLSNTIHIGKIFKEHFPTVLTIAGGVHLTVHPEDGIDDFDFVMTGEGEDNFRDFCNTYREHPTKSKDNFKNVKSLVWREPGGGVDKTPTWDLVDDLDALPLPAYDLVPMLKYQDFLITGERAVCIMTGRGCPYACTFCTEPLLTKRTTRNFSIDYVFRLMQLLQKNYGYTSFRIFDDTFTSDKLRTFAFCDEIHKLNWNINWSCLTHVGAVNEDVFRAIKGAGCSSVALGIESGDDKVLKLINKGINTNHAIKAMGWSQKQNLFVEALFMIGHPGETPEALDRTVNFSAEYNPVMRNGKRAGYNWFQFSVPWPGSELEKNWHEYGTCVVKHWDDYDHNSPYFVPFGITIEQMIEARNRGLAGVFATKMIPTDLCW